MCVILIGEIEREQHKLALEQNRDGFSLFTRELGLIKAPTQKQVEKALGSFGVWHYRIASSGRIDKDNIHPFEICRGRYLLYHNGVLGTGKGSKSDTAALAYTLYNVNLTTARSVVKALAGSTNRFAIVSSSDPRNFELFGDWVADAGIIMSHRLYQKSLPKGGTYYGTTVGNILTR